MGLIGDIGSRAGRMPLLAGMAVVWGAVLALVAWLLGDGGAGGVLAVAMVWAAGAMGLLLLATAFALSERLQLVQMVSRCGGQESGRVDMARLRQLAGSELADLVDLLDDAMRRAADDRAGRATAEHALQSARQAESTLAGEVRGLRAAQAAATGALEQTRTESERAETRARQAELEVQRLHAALREARAQLADAAAAVERQAAAVPPVIAGPGQQEAKALRDGLEALAAELAARAVDCTADAEPAAPAKPAHAGPLADAADRLQLLGLNLRLSLTHLAGTLGTSPAAGAELGHLSAEIDAACGAARQLADELREDESARDALQQTPVASVRMETRGALEGAVERLGSLLEQARELAAVAAPPPVAEPDDAVKALAQRLRDAAFSLGAEGRTLPATKDLRPAP